MRTSGWFVVLVAVALFGFTLLANEKPSDAYVKAMRDAQAAQAGLGAAAAAKDYDGVARHAATFKASFTAAESFWTAKRVDDAIAFSRAALKAANDLEAAAKAKDDEGITAARRAIGGTCQSCHMAHRERLADGTFEIK